MDTPEKLRTNLQLQRTIPGMPEVSYSIRLREQTTRVPFLLQASNFPFLRGGAHFYREKFRATIAPNLY